DDIYCWQTCDVGNTGGLNTCGFDGGFFDGRYVHFVPFVSPGNEGVLHRNKKYIFHSNFLRYDTLKPFDAPESWVARDASQTGGLETIGPKITVEYNGEIVVDVDARNYHKPFRWFDRMRRPLMERSREGYIALQTHGSKVWFRNIGIQEINNKKHRKGSDKVAE
ncbi:unnamed protein product, partial [marine sediment metagenome]